MNTTRRQDIFAHHRHNNHNLIFALNIVNYSVILSNEINTYLLGGLKLPPPIIDAPSIGSENEPPTSSMLPTRGRRCTCPPTSWGGIW